MGTHNQVDLEVEATEATTHIHTKTTTTAANTNTNTNTLLNNKKPQHEEEEEEKSAENEIEYRNEQLLAVNTEIEEKHYAYMPKASEPAQVIIIPATQASTVATNAAKKIRRAFSMPRNPFRWSRKFKTSFGVGVGNGDGDTNAGEVRNSAIISSCVSGGRENAGSTVSLSDGYQAVVGKDTKLVEDNDDGDSEKKQDVDAKILLKNCDSKKPQISNNNNNNNNNNADSGGGGNRVIRRSSLRKFLNRIAQHVSSTVNIGVSNIDYRYIFKK